ncbi:phosphogluconate dehydratase [Roseiterribacter gracilis]|uniref:phosphogluconate dehydratase n=1 Tax=Roseiterribacter gracilis TaxID=2812848 RepID=UPI003B42A415
MHSTVARVTERLQTRSEKTRSAYEARMQHAAANVPARFSLSCGNLAHGFAASGVDDKLALKRTRRPNIAIVSAYNDMLSAHQPYERFPAIIKEAVRTVGAVAQFAGGVPAMCDGVTQGRTGMELSLFSRDTIAMATGIALSHAMFDGALMLGICDKIVPGLMIGSAVFGHLPIIFVPGGPMTTGLSNSEKARVRQLFAEGKVGRDELLEAESASYHGPGTCTFYGTANSNQMLMEIMGLHLPGASFVPPNTKLRDRLTRAASQRVVAIDNQGSEPTPFWRVFDARALVNGVVGLLATGGSTNHTLHLIAMGAAAGLRLTWDDFDELSSCVPLLTRIYPNGQADVNHFHAAGGMSLLISDLLDAKLLHEDVTTVVGQGLDHYRQEPFLTDAGEVAWRDGPRATRDMAVLAPLDKPFAPDGGLRVLHGGLGRAVIKISAVKEEHRIVEAPAIVFDDQDQLLAAFKDGKLDRDFVAVVRFQGPKANGMPELHKLTPSLGVLQDKGFKVALVTDGRMSGASGKVPAAIHVTPESAEGGPLARVRDGDVIRLDARAGVLEIKLDAAEFAARPAAQFDPRTSAYGTGRELFEIFRRTTGGAERGASVFDAAFDEPKSELIDA